MIQECDRLKGIIEEQSQRLSSLKGEYDFACKEVKRLANEISAKVGDCSIGPWCNGCEHKMEAVIKKKSYDCTNMWTSYSGESVIYCGKHRMKFVLNLKKNIGHIHIGQYESNII